MNAMDFVGAFEKLTRVYQQARKLAVGDTGLSEEQLSVLTEATRRPGSSLGVVASALSMSASAATRVVRDLVKKGLLKDEPEVVEPTEQGQQIGTRAMEELWSGFAQAMGGAGAIANAVAGLINTAASALDRWVERSLPEKAEPSKPAPAPKKRKAKSAKK